MGDVLYKPEDVWDSLCSYVPGHSEWVCTEIAENPDYGVAIYVDGNRCGGTMDLSVYIDDDEAESEMITSLTCESAVQEYYEKYIYTFMPPIVDEYDEFSEEYYDEQTVLEEESFYRENELTEAVTDFCEIACIDKHFITKEDQEIVEDIKEHILEYMAVECGLKIYRPLPLEMDDGTEMYFEYPYEVMEFDNDTNVS